MLRRLSCLALACLFSCPAAILPDRFAGAAKQPAAAPAVNDRAIWEEYGLEATERAVYQKVTITAWRFKDPTGALAGFQWLRPEDSRPSKLAELAVEFQGGVLIAFGNYVIRLDGGAPAVQQLDQLFSSLPRLDQSSLPTLPGFVPQQNRIPNSERYILGPAALAKFVPQVTPSVAAFSMGAEAQLAKYRVDGAETTLAVFSYPTPHIARQRVDEFQRQPGVMAKRTGSLVAIVPAVSDANAAEKLLALVRYNATITWSEPTTPQKQLNWGNALISIFVLTGILLLFCLVAGIAFGGFRVLLRRLAGKRGDEDPMILLHLDR
jgi:hypothetical protein